LKKPAGLSTTSTSSKPTSFAAQALAVGKELGWDSEKVNVTAARSRSAIPIRSVRSARAHDALHEMNRRDSKKGLVTLCIGGGMGVAMCIER
jgi:acetyl-CoA C-acetyltransferase